MNYYQRRAFIRLCSKATAFAFTYPRIPITQKITTMTDQKNFDVIIVGGSYAGLAAGMALGRALMKVLIIDDGKPCNRQTPHSHNFLTHDGKTPHEISALANLQVQRYSTVSFFTGTAVSGKPLPQGFEIRTGSGEVFQGKKIIFASGIKDRLPDIDGLAASWGISVLHCPYCHGYEVRNEKTGILGNGDTAVDFAALIYNWSKDLVLYTNGPSRFTAAQRKKLQQHTIPVIEKEILQLQHDAGQLQKIVFTDGTTASIRVLYAPSPFEQHCKIPETLGCAFTDEGYIKVNSSQETTVPGIYAVGDNAAKMRTVANAVAAGTTAGIALSKKMITEEF